MPVVPIVSVPVVSIDQGKRQPGARGDEHRPGQTSAGPRAAVVSIVAGAW